MRVGYARVSTEEQNLFRQEDLLASLKVEKIFLEKISGKTTERPQLKSMLEFLRDGDELIVESYSRLARSSKDLLEIVDYLRNKGISFFSQKENFNTSTPQGKFMLTVFAGLAELERDTILVRQKEGIAASKARGVRFGRPKIKKPQEFNSIAEKVVKGEIRAVDAIQKLNMSKASFYRLLKLEGYQLSINQDL